MRPLYDVIAIGDTTEDVFLDVSAAQVKCDEGQKNCLLCVENAAKIAVEKKTDVPAVGNAANHAIGIARMGLQAAIYTVLGDDMQGHIAHEVFRDNHVDTRYVVFDHKRGTNFSVVINHNTERTIFVYHEPREYKLPWLEKARWLYLTSSSGQGVVVLHGQVLDFLADHIDVKLAFNPGTHQMRLGLDALKPLLAKTDLLFLNREEAAELLGRSTDDVAVLIRGFHRLGVKTFVLTDGPAGAYASDGKQIWHLKIYEGPVVERTGAGDSFGSGMLAAIIKGKTLPEAMTWGNANSTSVVQFIGAREGLLTELAALKMIEANAKIKPEAWNQISAPSTI